MNFLFVHGNYPAQFRHLAALLGQNSEHNVVFLTARKDSEANGYLPGVQVRQFSTHRIANSQTHHYLTATEEAVIQGQAVIRSISDLNQEGFRPRVVITHGGMGLGLFIKDLLPDSLHIGYFEWYFRPETTKYLLPNFDLDKQLKTNLRNLSILQELETCDKAVIPTEWQKKQFPKTYQKKLEVIFDGIDENFFHHCPDKASLESKEITIQNRETGQNFAMRAGNKILSYATRGMEPLRGFPEFMRAVPTLLENEKNLQIIIAGADRRAYSYDAPSHNGSWKDHLMDELGSFSGIDRVSFTGLLSYSDYRLLLWRSNLHCYFTRPYVTSWSLFESAACGACLAVNETEATANIIEKQSVTWLDLDEPKGLAPILQMALDKKETKGSRILHGFELSKSLEEWEKLLNKGLQDYQ